MQFRNIFVTVGTTEFTELISTVLSEPILDQLIKLGCENLLLQIGRGRQPSDKEIIARSEINIDYYRLKPSILDDINTSDLIISHAGAGSCIEILNANKPLIVVVNDTLMNNHQAELAEQLSSDGYLYYCTPLTLATTLDEFDHEKLRKYEKGNVKQFVKHLNNFMGF